MAAYTIISVTISFLLVLNLLLNSSYPLTPVAYSFTGYNIQAVHCGCSSFIYRWVLFLFLAFQAVQFCRVLVPHFLIRHSTLVEYLVHRKEIWAEVDVVEVPEENNHNR